jgi:hypothetical protein
MSYELKSLLTLIGLIFASAGLTAVVLYWFVRRSVYNHDDQA